jgi:hypothetical protein
VRLETGSLPHDAFPSSKSVFEDLETLNAFVLKGDRMLLTKIQGRAGFHTCLLDAALEPSSSKREDATDDELEPPKWSSTASRRRSWRNLPLAI